MHFLLQNLHKLIELRTIDDAQIVCTTISSNGEFLLYSTDEDVRLFHLTYEVCTLMPARQIPEFHRSHESFIHFHLMLLFRFDRTIKSVPLTA